MSEVEISNPNSLIKCSERRGRGGGEGGGGGGEKVGPVSRSDAFFHAVFTFYRKSFAFQPFPSLPPSLPQFQFNRNTTFSHGMQREGTDLTCDRTCIRYGKGEGGKHFGNATRKGKIGLRSIIIRIDRKKCVLLLLLLLPYVLKGRFA